QIAHIGLALLNQVDCPAVQLLEIIGGVMHRPAPLEAEPCDVRLDGLNVLVLLLLRVGVVKAQTALAIELAGAAKVKADGPGVADVEIRVRLWRKAGDSPADDAL